MSKDLLAVVRCKNCTFVQPSPVSFVSSVGVLWCPFMQKHVTERFYCAHGKDVDDER